MVQELEGGEQTHVKTHVKAKEYVHMMYSQVSLYDDAFPTAYHNLHCVV